MVVHLLLNLPGLRLHQHSRMRHLTVAFIAHLPHLLPQPQSPHRHRHLHLPLPPPLHLVQSLPHSKLQFLQHHKVHRAVTNALPQATLKNLIVQSELFFVSFFCFSLAVLNLCAGKLHHGLVLVWGVSSYAMERHFAVFALCLRRDYLMILMLTIQCLHPSTFIPFYRCSYSPQSADLGLTAKWNCLISFSSF